MTNQNIMIKRALLSVSDKTGLVEFAHALADQNVELISTGGTATMIREAGLNVKDVSEVTGFPEMMDGRIKTLHPKIHGGLLAIRGNKDHDKAAADHDIAPIDLLVVNLYPFEETVAKGGGFDECIENIDIGGPAMIRAASKNFSGVTVLTDTKQYRAILDEMATNDGATTYGFRKSLAHEAFAKTAAYDGAISNYLGAILENEDDKPEGFPRTFTVQFQKAQTMRYGENPHQKAAFYTGKTEDASISTARQLSGKELSYNNIADTDAALECVKQFNDAPTCVIVKHANPCGVACADDLKTAYDRAFATDPESAFGGIIAFNQALDAETAQEIIDRQFVEVIIAPEISDEAAAAVAKKKNVRLLECGVWTANAPKPRLDFKKINGGLLVQDCDLDLNEKLETVTDRAPTDDEMRDLLFAWKICKFVKSNAIIYCKDLQTIGVGAGQMSRVNSARIAAIKAELAGLEIKNTVVASDAFFPFADGLLAAAEAGASAVIQPGGSMRDQEVIDAANEKGLAMVMTGMRHFRH